MKLSLEPSRMLKLGKVTSLSKINTCDRCKRGLSLLQPLLPQFAQIGVALEKHSRKQAFMKINAGLSFPKFAKSSGHAQEPGSDLV